MASQRTVSPYARDAARLLGARIRLARGERRWSQRELAGRAGITIPTLRKIENGELGVSLGSAFEVAALTGVTLFYPDRERLPLELDRTLVRGALLPQRIRTPEGPAPDDF